MAAVVVAGRQFDRQVRHAELLVDADLTPNTGIARVRPRVSLPRVVAKFARRRDGMENPEAFAGTDVEAANVPFDVRAAGRDAARLVRGADDDDVARNDGRGMQTDFSAERIDRLIHFEHQIDRATLPERRNRRAGLRIEGDQTIAWRDVEDAFFAPVTPIRKAAAG